MANPTSTIEAQTDAIAEEVGRIAGHGWLSRTTLDAHADGRYVDVWVELAAPTHGGACPDDPSEQTTPAWDLVERGEVRGVTGGQCAGCGRYGAGWLSSGAAKVATLGPDERTPAMEVTSALAALARDLDGRRRHAIGALAERRLAALQAAHADALEAIRRGEPDEVAHLCSGSDAEPSTYLDGIKLVTWDYDPADPMAASGVLEVATELSEEGVALFAAGE